MRLTAEHKQSLKPSIAVSHSDDQSLRTSLSFLVSKRANYLCEIWYKFPVIVGQSQEAA